MLGLVGTSAVSAHSAEVYYPQHWHQNSIVHWQIDNGLPTGEFRDEIRAGFHAWSDLAGGRGPEFVFDGEGTLQNAYTPCAGPNAVYCRDPTTQQPSLGTGILGYTLGCRNTSTGDYHGFSMILDNNPPGAWHVGDGDVPTNGFDVQSVVTHEAGHATGFYGHFEVDLYCGGPDTQTICGYYPEAYRKAFRALGGHDTHTLDNAYPYIQPSQ